MTTTTVQHEREAGTCPKDGGPHFLFQLDGAKPGEKDWVCYKCTEAYVEEQDDTVGPPETNEATVGSTEPPAAPAPTETTSAPESPVAPPPPEVASEGQTETAESAPEVAAPSGSGNGTGGTVSEGDSGSDAAGSGEVQGSEPKPEVGTVPGPADHGAIGFSKAHDLKPLTKQGSVVVEATPQAPRA